MAFNGSYLLKLTSFYWAVDTMFGLIVDPVEACFHSQLGQETVLFRSSIRRCYIHSPAFIVQRARRMVAIFIPGLCHTQAYPWPLVHHCNSQPVQALLTSLRGRIRKRADIHFGALRKLVNIFTNLSAWAPISAYLQQKIATQKKNLDLTQCCFSSETQTNRWWFVSFQK